MMTGEWSGPVPTGYKAWVFGTKLAGVLAFAVGIELLTRGHLAWAGLMLFAGAAVVVAPVRSPAGWRAGKWWRG